MHLTVSSKEKELGLKSLKTLIDFMCINRSLVSLYTT